MVLALVDMEFEPATARVVFRHDEYRMWYAKIPPKPNRSSYPSYCCLYALLCSMQCVDFRAWAACKNLLFNIRQQKKKAVPLVVSVIFFFLGALL